MRSTGAKKSEVGLALRTCRHAILAVAVFSAFMNVLALTGSIFMMEVYDRVLPSQSIPTLTALLVIALGLYGAQGLLDVFRARLLVRVGLRLDEQLARRVNSLVTRAPLQAPARVNGLEAGRDSDTIRSFWFSAGPAAFFDLPWMPLYLLICFSLHFWIGITVLVGAGVLIGLALCTEIFTREPVQNAFAFDAARRRLSEAAGRNAEAVLSMGMSERLFTIWNQVNRNCMARHSAASDISAGLGAAGRAARMMLQSTVLAVGAYLVIQQETTAGVIIAASILSARALAPVDMAIGNWKGLVAARQARRRLDDALRAIPEKPKPMALPAPECVLSVDRAAVAPPDTQFVSAQEITFELRSGHGLGVIGPSGSGKSSLARLLVGLWAPVRGSVRLDGASLDQWIPEQLGSHIGYLPQSVELLEGTIAENISRFEPNADAGEIVAAAQAACVHDLILKQKIGYDTQIGANGVNLSAGQKQRIGLARALYRRPFLVVLDEPNSNLDAAGEEALTQAILSVRNRGGIAVVIAHRPSALAGVDQILVMGDGRQQAFGPKDQIMAQVVRPLKPSPIVRVVPGAAQS